MKDLFDFRGQVLREGDRVSNRAGKEATIRFGYYTHHIGEVSSPAFGVYFDGDDGFYFSDHLKSNGFVSVLIIPKET